MNEKPLNLASYHSKIVGVTFEGRQDVIARLRGDESLRFRREPENEYDSNAVAIDVLIDLDPDGSLRGEWSPIGYIARDKNKELASVLSDGRFASIKINDITGGGDKSYGVNVYIEYERPRKLVRSVHAKLEKDIFGNEIYYDPFIHQYTNALGEIYLSGSRYASEEKFDAKLWANEAVKRHNLDPSAAERIMNMWKTNGEASREFGNALHKAIELYGQYHDIADIIDIDLNTKKRKLLPGKVEKNSAMSKLPYLQDVVKQFFTPERLAESAQYEVLVVDHKNRRVGRIDRLIMLPDGSYEVRDMKTNNKIMKKERDTHTKQLSFYADIILANGRELGENPIMLHHWEDNTWKDIKLEKVNTL